VLPVLCLMYTAYRSIRFRIIVIVFLGIFSYVTDEEKLFRASDGMCVVSSDQVYSEGDKFRYGQHMWYATHRRSSGLSYHVTLSTVTRVVISAIFYRFFCSLSNALVIISHQRSALAASHRLQGY